MKIGIRQGSLGNPETKDVFAMAAELGYDGVELEVAADYEDTLLASAKGRAQLKQYVAETGVEVRSLCVGALWKTSPAATDPDNLARALPHLAGHRGLRRARREVVPAADHALRG